jgi:peptidoglycan/xylan/chitin deacetylase (PgdA/CDA1 family)
MTATLKAIVGQSLFASHLHAVLLKNAAVVVAFHRVQNVSSSNGLTIGVRMFERYCRFFMRHFRVVPLPDLVRNLEQAQGLNRQLAITFDDGYRDNFELAAPVLEKLALPATFFVVTQWIGTDVVPFWDREEGVRHPWMTWEQVRALHRRGFDVGAHTCTHADLGRVSENVARAEIFGARLELEKELAAPVESFAYPYGGWGNISEPNRLLVKAAGFRCCCSCAGGTISQGTDPFHVPRIPISNWYGSPPQFGFDVALRRSVQPA